MCTLIALHRCVDRAGLVVAANRDEYFDRPSEGPALRSTPTGPIVSPLDLRAGGTWFGVNATGVFAALTNRPCTEPDPASKSRGLVPTEALAAATAEQAAEWLANIPAGTHNPFNAFVADGESAWAVVYEDSPRLTEMAPGAHVIGNADPDDRTNAKIARVLAQAEAAAALPLEAALDALRHTCSEHDCGGERGALEDTCVHLDGYGTRSSFLAALACPNDDDRRLLFADGSPCQTDYEDFTALFSELTQAARYGAVEHQARTTG